MLRRTRGAAFAGGMYELLEVEEWELPDGTIVREGEGTVGV